MIEGQNRKGVFLMSIQSRVILLLLPVCLLLTGCYHDPEPPQNAPVQMQQQTLEQLHLSPPEPDSHVIAAWIPYFTVDALLTASDPKAAVTAYLTGLRDLGVNTVFVHVCAFGESGYPSAYYPLLPTAAKQNVMELFQPVCRELGISFHAWINPLRLQTEAYMDAQSGDSALRAWYQDPEARAAHLSKWDGRYYLNPAADSTCEFLTGAITELISQYHPDGVHIDDYFYPTGETAFDAQDFAVSGASDLSEWRRGNITELMHQMNSAVHSADPDAVFSVSPQGNLRENREALYADVPAWLTENPCCDWIIPQIYFGYEHESAPFAEILRMWQTLPRSETVRLIIGLAAYKSGQPDPYAGAGASEWCAVPDLLVRQASDILRDHHSDGAAFYHADALLGLPPETAAALKSALQPEQQNAAEN